MKSTNTVLFCILAASPCVWATQYTYTGSNVTGLITVAGTVNLMQAAQSIETQFALHGLAATSEKLPTIGSQLRPPLPLKSNLMSQAAQAVSAMAVSTSFTGSGFPGLTHYDQRNANNGNQFSVEPPSQGLAVANGYVLEGVNNAVQVYTTAGSPLLPQVLSSNQVFGLAPAINRSTGVNGVFTTDIRTFYDPDIQRWFIIQWAQLNDAEGNLLNLSQEWIAVSQTTDPTQTYTIYTMNTTDYPVTPTSGRNGCPCFPDYPQIGADLYGFYISSNEFNTSSQSFVGASVLAISKASLASNSQTPVAFKFNLPYSTGYEVAIQPATTPPGGSYFTGSNGVEYFASTVNGFGGGVAVWAMINTNTLSTTNPSPILLQNTVSTLSYSSASEARQKPGPLPYGSTLVPPGQLAYLDGGDTRVLSVVYVGGRLYLTFGTIVTDQNDNYQAGGAYVVLSPTYRSGSVNATVLQEGYLVVNGDNVLRPAIAVNAQGGGAIVFTLVGPDYFPSAAMVPIHAIATATGISIQLGSTLQIAGAGVAPEDGFTGYNPGSYGTFTARWGDYSAATVAADGSIWMGTEFIPGTLRTQYANWGTYLMRFIP